MMPISQKIRTQFVFFAVCGGDCVIGDCVIGDCVVGDCVFGDCVINEIKNLLLILYLVFICDKSLKNLQTIVLSLLDRLVEYESVHQGVISLIYQLRLFSLTDHHFY